MWVVHRLWMESKSEKRSGYPYMRSGRREYEGVITMERTKGRAIVGSILGIIVVIMLLSTLYSLNWYYYRGREGKEVVKMEQGLYAQRTTIGDEVNTTDYSDDPRWEGGEVPRVLDDVRFLFILGLILAIIFELLALVVGWGRFIPGGIPLLIGVIAGLILIATPVYMMTTYPESWESDVKNMDFDSNQTGPWRHFSGGGTDTSLGEVTKTSFGPGWAFYFSIISGVILLIAASLCAGIKRKKLEGHLRPRSVHDEYEARPVGHGYGGPESVEDFYVDSSPERGSYDSSGYDFDSLSSYSHQTEGETQCYKRPTFCPSCRGLLRPELDHCIFCNAPIPGEKIQ